jgi:hypothetical protein
MKGTILLPDRIARHKILIPHSFFRCLRCPPIVRTVDTLDNTMDRVSMVDSYLMYSSGNHLCPRCKKEMEKVIPHG